MIIFAAILVGGMLLAACEIQIGGTTPKTGPPPSPVAFHSGIVLGIAGNAPTSTSYPGIPWVRLGYPTCGSKDLSGQVLKDTISSYHSQGMRVLLTYCQTSGDSLFATNPLNDVAQAGADAVQCGNEQMKQSATTLYVTPERFARFFDLCQSAIHAVSPAIPVILGAMDPLVVPDDDAKLMNQVHYLDAMQSAMNSSVHPGGNWNWRSQTLGLIDSWHNGYPDAGTNNLYQQYVFWAQQLHVNNTGGDLGKHLWVVEGTGCVNGCGIDASNPREVAISHIVTLITDVQTTIKYGVPFFYFSGADFYNAQYGWIFGVLDVNGHPKPLRQDLQMGAVKLTMSCSSGKIVMADQEQLLAKLYSGCTLPTDFTSTLES
ncbi:MAG TPA: hypothetical protein VJO32_02480 [Ktedonobacteraceae bacterium]|nr:hypothetical protein [Ktedonobacteraceae bacterium]